MSRSDQLSAYPPNRLTAVLLGADAGGSHSVVVIGRADGTVLGRAVGPGAAMRPGGAAASAAALADTARRAAEGAGVSLPADRAVIGAAGAGRSQEQQELAAALVQAGIAKLARVLADAEVALAAAFENGAGIIINAGTGSIAYARDAAGQLHRRGGYGWQLGDEGSGYWLGRRALDAAARALDGRGEGSTLPARLLSGLGLEGFDDLVRWTATATPAQVAALAPQVFNAAREGDAVAQRILREAAAELAALARGLERHFPGMNAIPVALTGGLLFARSPLAAELRQALAAEMPRARLSTEPVDTAVGALRLAAETVSGER
jgi:N-acetylglucosamine kinase-like BadF-type ATPase